MGEGGEENNTASLPQPLDTWLSAGGKSLDPFAISGRMLLPWSSRPIWVSTASVVPLKETRYNTLPPPLKNILPPSVPAIVTVHEAASGVLIGTVRGTSWTVVACCRKYVSAPPRGTGRARRTCTEDVLGRVFLTDILECTKEPCFLSFSGDVDRCPSETLSDWTSSGKTCLQDVSLQKNSSNGSGIQQQRS